MISELSLYLITRCDPIGKTLFVLAFISAILLFILLIGNIIAFCGQEDKECAKCLPNIRKARSYVLIIFLAMCIGNALIPTTKEMAFIVVVPKIVNSDFVQKDIPEEVKAIYTYAKDYLKSKLVIENHDEPQQTKE